MKQSRLSLAHASWEGDLALQKPGKYSGLEDHAETGGAHRCCDCKSSTELCSKEDPAMWQLTAGKGFHKGIYYTVRVVNWVPFQKVVDHLNLGLKTTT